MAYFLDNYPVSENSSNLALTEEQEKYCRVVYKLDEEGGAGLTGLWDPEAEYSDEYVIVPLRSTDAAVEVIPANTIFANVVGSSHDLYPEKYKDPDKNKDTWMHLWIMLTKSGFVRDCSTTGRFYYINEEGAESYHTMIYLHNSLYPSNAQCCQTIVGGHVILNATHADIVPKDGLVYIIPICATHNIASSTCGGTWGVGFYMRLKYDTNALKLQGYLLGIKKYIKEFENEIRHE